MDETQVQEVVQILDEDYRRALKEKHNVYLAYWLSCFEYELITGVRARGRLNFEQWIDHGEPRLFKPGKWLLRYQVLKFKLGF